MTIQMQQGLPYVQVSLVYRHQQKIFTKVLLDTGSAGTVFAADAVLDLRFTI
jgi:hypothetical protein